jgi:DNA-binding MarR family transcriptional regulator
MEKHEQLRKTDYRDVKEPNLTARQVLITMEKEYETFGAKEVQEAFDITMGDACMRVKRLEKWGTIRQVPPLKARNREFEVTDWGRKMAKKWADEE